MISPKHPVPSHTLIIGRNCLREVLLHCPERILKIFVAESKSQSTGVRQEILELAQRHRITIETLKPADLDELAGTESHQSFAAIIKDRHYHELKNLLQSLENRSQASLLLLDGVTDPQNFGAILRAAECFGIDAVIWSKNRSSGITPVVTKASVGASELVALAPVSNLADALKKCKEANFWIVAATAEEGATDLTLFEFPERSAILIGAEGKGLSDIALKQADFKVKIPMKGRISALNVSQATSIFIYKYSMLHAKH